MPATTLLYRYRPVLLLLCLILATSLTRLLTTGGIARVHVAAADVQCTPSSISANFNGTAIGAGDTLWFSSVLKVGGAPAGATVTVRFDQASISYVVNGATTTLPAPGGVVTFSPAAAAASTAYDPGSNTWTTVVPAGLGGNTFLSGMAVPLPAGLPGGVQPVTWSGRFSSDTPGVSVSWQWAAAAYTQFNTDYAALGVKPVDDPQASSYKDSDHAGTPEGERGFVTGGARGGGGANFTGSYSGTQSNASCPLPAATATATPVPPTATPTASATVTATPTATPISSCTADTPPVCITSFTVSATSVPVGTSVTFIETTNLDVGPTPYFIDILDENGDFVGQGCGGGTSCTFTVSSSVAATHQYTAALVSDVTHAQWSPSITVTWN